MVVVRARVRTKRKSLNLLLTQDTVRSKQDRYGLNHREAEGHLPQQFGGDRVVLGDFAIRTEEHASVLSHDGQSGAMLREVANLDKDIDTLSTLAAVLWSVQPLSSAIAADSVR